MEQAKGINPIVVEKGEGVYFMTTTERYLDFSSGLMNVNIDMAPCVAAAIMRQMNQISYVSPGCATKVRGELGKNWLQ